MVDDVTVGEVTEVERVGWHARVTLRVRDDIVLPDNAIAEIRQVSLLGEKYVALERAHRRRARRPARRQRRRQHRPRPHRAQPRGRGGARRAVDACSPVAASPSSAPSPASSTRRWTGASSELRDLLGSLDRFVGTLDDQKGDIIRALESLNNLTATLNREKTTITGRPRRHRPRDRRARASRPTSWSTCSPRSTASASSAPASSGPASDDLLAQLRDLRPIVKNLSAAGDALAPGLNLLVSFPFPKEASEIVLGDYANTSIRADISLENFLPQGGTPSCRTSRACPTCRSRHRRRRPGARAACAAARVDSAGLPQRARARCRLMPELLAALHDPEVARPGRVPRPRPGRRPARRPRRPRGSGTCRLGDLPGLDGLGRLSARPEQRRPRAPRPTTTTLFGGAAA